MFAVSARATERGIARIQAERFSQTPEQRRLAAFAQKKRELAEKQQRERIRKWFADANAAFETPRIAHAILRDVASAADVDVELITGRSRTGHIVTARQWAMYEIYARCPHMSLPMIGRIFKRDHTTVLHATRVWPPKAKAAGIPITPISRTEGKN